MIKFFGSKKKEDSPSYRKEKAESLSGRAIKYVTERSKDGSTDTIIGKAGSLSVRDGELIVLASQQIVFRCKTENLTASDLMSLEGVVLEGYDEVQGQVRKIIAYYTYYRS
ncbi:MAG: hypothetical protein HFE78_06695 [Clostridiales bacterium]|nr:hypothetical protein [Clostridiales bacterium]